MRRRLSSISTSEVGMILAGMPGGVKSMDNRISGMEESSPEKDLKKELDEQYNICKHLQS